MEEGFVDDFAFVEDELPDPETLLKHTAEGIKLVLSLYRQIEQLQDRLSEIFYYEPELYEAAEDYLHEGLAYDVYKEYIEEVKK